MKIISYPTPNHTSNMNTTYEILIAKASYAFYGVVVSVVFVICIMILGNLFVIISVFTYKPLRIRPNYYIVSLAVADLMLSLFVLPFSLLYAVLDDQWVLGEIACKIWLTLDIFVCTASIHSICAIAFDRYYAITEPIAYARNKTWRTITNKMIVVWGLSTLISLPPLFGWNNWPDDFTEDMACDPTTEVGYVVFSSLGSFYIPLFVMSNLYFKIYKSTFKRLKSAQYTIADPATKIRKKISATREIRFTITLGIVMGVFTLCWLPFFLMYVLIPFCDECFSTRIKQFIIWLGYINSAANPVIYTIFNLDFRRAFMQIAKFELQK